jgi:hypothetical protein
MFSNRIALTALAVGCVSAAGIGGYLATRQNVVGVAAPDAIAASAPVATPPQPVQETEALVGTAVKPQPPVSFPQSTAGEAKSKRSEVATRPAARPQSVQATAARPVEQPPALERTWPSGSNGSSSSATTPPVDNQLPVAHAEERQQDITLRAPEPPAKTFEELVVSADSVVGLQTETALSSERARVEDRVEARVVRDVRVGGEVAIPAGARALGTVTLVERGGKFKERARLGIRFQTLVLADGTRLPITTETIYRYGDAPGNGTAARIGGGAVVGAIIGGIIGGGKGAAIGATTGAGAGTASVMAGDRDAATIPAGAEVTARILSPVTVTVERE